MRRFRFTIWTLLIAILVLAAILAASQLFRDRVSLQNQSPHRIVAATITICGQQLRFENIDPGTSASVPFEITGDGHFDITAKLADGRILHSSGGYVTGGMHRVRATVVVTDEGQIEVKQD